MSEFDPLFVYPSTLIWLSC